MPDLETWLAHGEAVALATVVSTWGSAPRPAGSFMAVNAQGQIAGSVSGGCVEGAVVEAAKESLKTGQGRLLHFGVADETAWDVGLACGGNIDIFVQPLVRGAAEAALEAIKAEQDVGIATVIGGNEALLGAQLMSSQEGPLFNSEQLSGEQLQIAGEAIGRIQGMRRETVGDMEWFINHVAPSPTLVMVGGSHIAVALAQIAKTAQFRTVVVDPRRAFGTEARFAEVDSLLQVWPGEAFEQMGLTRSTAMASLSHDPKIDDPALIAALASQAFYVGALGSQRTHAKRLKRLAEKGVSEADLARIHSPIGLEINALTPEEIAVAVMAEVIGAFRGGAF
ncbi:MAG: XdhC family protein [Chloroflexi bacterium]|nr:XdhC family protein [Chloroflexota bacterium]